MAKPKIPSQKSRYGALNQRLNKYLLLVQQIFDDLNLEAAKAATSVSYDTDAGKPFRFSDYPTLTQRVNDLQKRYVDDIGAVIYSGTSAEWKKSNEVQDLLADGVLKAYGAQVNGERYKIYYQPNNDALKAFQKRRANGMTLSQKLWNQASNYRQEMEYAISSAIEKGTSAVTLSKRLSKYLHDFPSLQKDYKEKFGKAADCHDCEYRSMRLARSEINMAYRTAEQTRWEQMDFVVGYEIKLSGSHPAEDICDMLKGKYPKDFVWTGWHPNDLCYKIPILKTEEEFWNYGEARNKPSEKEVKDVPDAFTAWVIKNRDRIQVAESRGTLPFFLSDNRRYYSPYMSKESSIRWRHSHRDEKTIRQAWANRAWLKEDGSYHTILQIYQHADVLGIDVSDLDSFLKTVAISPSTEERYESIKDAAMSKVLSALKRYDEKRKALYSIKEELASPLGTYHLKYWKRKVNEYYASLPTIYGIKYGVNIDVGKLDKIVADSRRRIDAKVAERTAENNAKIAKALSTKQLKPMTHDVADHKHPNVGYRGKLDEFGVNCQCCVVSYEMRRRGFDVTAMPNFKDGKFPQMLSKDTTLIWMDDIGRKPKKTPIQYPSWKKKDGVSVREYVESQITQDGRYHFNFGWDKDHGHIVCVEKIGDEIMWYDPQVNQILDDGFFAMIDTSFLMYLLRVDNLRINHVRVAEVVRKIRSAF